MKKDNKIKETKPTKPCEICGGPYDYSGKKVNDPFYYGKASFRFRLEDRIILRGKKKQVIYKHVKGDCLCYDCFQNQLKKNDD